MKRNWTSIFVTCLVLVALVLLAGISLKSNREVVQLRQQLREAEQRLHQVEAKLQLRTQLLGMTK